MRCQTCGEELREGARFCPTCGTPTAAADPLTPPTVQIRRPQAPPTDDEPVAPYTSEPAYAPEPATEPPTEPLTPPVAAPSPRASRDPGAGYDPTGSSRPAPQSVRTTTVAPARARPDSDQGGGGSAPRLGSAALGAPTSADFNRLRERVTRLLRFDTSVFGEVYKDTSATVSVAIFAAIVLLLSGLGGYLFIANSIGFDRYELVAHGSGEFFFRSILLGTIFGLVLWLAWSFITSWLLRQFANVDADFLGIARVLGIALLPLVLALLLFIDDAFLGLSWIALGGVAALALVGVLEALDVRPGHAWLATLAGFAVFVIGLTILGDDLSDFAPGFFVGG